MRLFIEDLKGYTDVYDNVRNVFIRKVDNKNTIELRYINKTEKDYIPLNEIRLAFLVDLNNMEEYFRYEK